MVDEAAEILAIVMGAEDVVDRGRAGHRIEGSNATILPVPDRCA